MQLVCTNGKIRNTERPFIALRHRLRPFGDRAEVAAHLAGAWYQPHGSAARPTAVLCADDVPLSVRRRTPRRESFCVHGERHLWTIPAAHGTQCVRAPRLRRIRDSFGELRPQGRTASDGSHPAQHREFPATAGERRLDGRLALSPRDYRPQLLQVDAVALSPAVEAGARLQETGSGELVSRLQNRAGQRAGCWRTVRALLDGRLAA